MLDTTLFLSMDGLEKHDADHRLKQHLRTFDTILSTTTDFACVFDRSGRCVYANQSLLDFWGLKIEDAIGKNFFDLGYPDDLATRLQRQIQQVFDTKRAVKDERRYSNPTGIDGYREYILQPVFDCNGNVESVVGSARDISARKQIEEALRDAKSRLETTLYASEIATWTWDIRENRVVADENLARLFSLTQEGAAGGPSHQYLAAIHPDDRSRVEATVSEAIRGTGRLYEIDYRLIQADGSLPGPQRLGAPSHIRRHGIEEYFSCNLLVSLGEGLVTVLSFACFYSTFFGGKARAECTRGKGTSLFKERE